jgi:hypothetical protein
MSSYYFAGACILAIAVLVPLGAPVSAVAGGVTLAILIKIVAFARAKRGGPKP